jgi:anti-sigma factor (TIGR02949 family)
MGPEDLSCEQLPNTILPYLEGELPSGETARVQQHVAVCERCGAYAGMVRSALCEEIYGRVYAYLDRELSAADRARIERHLTICPHCSDRFSFEGNVLRYVRREAQRVSVSDPALIRILERFRAKVEAELA